MNKSFARLIDGLDSCCYYRLSSSSYRYIIVSRPFASIAIFVIAFVTTAVSVYCFWIVPGPPRPPVDITPGQIDLGKLWLHEGKDFEVLVSNPGNEVVEIRGVKADCACSRVRLEKARLEAGEKCRLSGSFTGAGKSGAVAHRLIVSIEKPTRCQYVIPIVGQVRRRVGFAPEIVTLRPDFSRQKRDVSALTIHNESDETVTLGLPKRYPLGIDVSGDTATVPPGGSWKLEVGASPSLVTNSTEEVVLQCSHPLEKEIKVPIRIEPVAGLSVNPNKVALGVVSREELLKQDIEVDLSGDLLLSCCVERVSCPDFLKARSIEGKTPGRHRLLFNCQDNFTKADLGGTIAVMLRERTSGSILNVNVSVSGFLTDAL